MTPLLFGDRCLARGGHCPPPPDGDRRTYSTTTSPGTFAGSASLGEHALYLLGLPRLYNTQFPLHNNIDLYVLKLIHLKPDATNLYPALENHNFASNSWPTWKLPAENSRCR